MRQPKRPPVFREDGTIEIQLNRGYVAIIDAEDAHLAQHTWSVMTTPQGKHYAMRTVAKGKVNGLHRAVMGLLPGRHPEVDHRDGDGLNCRRSNLRELSVAENRRNRRMPSNNTSGYMGVRRTTRGKPWQARIGRKHLGYFDTPEEANEARIRAEIEIWGEIHPQRAAALLKK